MLAKLPFGLLALGDVLHCADDADGLTGFVEHRFGLALTDPLDSIRTDDTVDHRGGRWVSEGPRDHVFHPLAVVGVNGLEEGFVLRLEALGIEAENPVLLVRPPELSGGDVPLPVPQACDPLGVGQPLPVFAQRRLSKSGFGDVGVKTHGAAVGGAPFLVPDPAPVGQQNIRQPWRGRAKAPKPFFDPRGLVLERVGDQPGRGGAAHQRLDGRARHRVFGNTRK